MILAVWLGAARRATVRLSHHINFVRNRSSGYGADRIGATTPPDNCQRARTCCAHVAMQNWTPSTARTWQPARASVAVSLRFAVVLVGHPRRLHFDDAERKSVRDHLSHRRQAGLACPLDDGVRFLGRRQRADGTNASDHRPGRVEHCPEQRRVAGPANRIHVDRGTDAVRAIGTFGAIQILLP
jgi:hypothetical protein